MPRKQATSVGVYVVSETSNSCSRGRGVSVSEGEASFSLRSRFSCSRGRGVSVSEASPPLGAVVVVGDKNARRKAVLEPGGLAVCGYCRQVQRVRPAL